MIYLVLAVIFFHIISLPIVVGVSVTTDSDEKTVTLVLRLFGIKIFAKTVELSKIERRDVREGADTAERAVSNGYIRNASIAVVKRVRIREISLDACIGTGDAAATAAVIGMIRIALAEVRTGFGCECGGSVRPDYDTERLEIDFFGIFSLCFADIIYALFSAANETIIDRRKKRRTYANNVAE